ncbi:hypothetical protein TYRP_014887 [Tyrophagus putrescentiae]|nr:hypothetical protein TYRP_014887 [Tyrophagus putrescentiae]
MASKLSTMLGSRSSDSNRNVRNSNNSERWSSTASRQRYFSEAFPVPLFTSNLPHDKLLRFADTGHRKCVHKKKVPRHFELLLGHFLLITITTAVLQLHPGANLLTFSRIRHSNDVRIEYRRMSVQQLLNFPRVNVLPTDNDQLLRSSDDFQEALLVHHSQVTGVVPSGVVNRLSRLHRVLPITDHGVEAS